MNKQKPQPKRRARNQTTLPKGWDQRRVEALAEYYDHQSDDDAIAEAEAAFNSVRTAMIEVPMELVPKVERLIGKR